ncbi:MAG: hypothetical protein A2Z83_04900 [Omnitrophica bacterium GWA2_52_8]|nr:MAG: hypothetical protein A2Z83_04900 [Omnitrophica bacterium GWA2_52_8]
MTQSPSASAHKKIPGFATDEGTAAYRGRFRGNLNDDFYRCQRGLYFASVGFGSYLGEPDDATDKLYEEALEKALSSGINVLDTAINYRAQRSERVYGKVLSRLIAAGQLRREEVIVSTKGGFIPFDSDYPEDSRDYFRKTYLDSGLLRPEDIAQGCHAMTPEYLEDQLNRSLKNLNLDTLDIYFLHNPETQLGEIDRKLFHRRMAEVFLWMEDKVRANKIRMYGTATWSGYRVPPQEKEFLSLPELEVLAREAGGAGHHFRALQMPVNLAMPEGWILANQTYGANEVSVLQLARKQDMIVMGSGALLQARLVGPFPEFLVRKFQPLETSAQRAIQFARSVPGVTVSLVGMKTSVHLLENLEVAKVPPIREEQLLQLFQENTQA